MWKQTMWGQPPPAVRRAKPGALPARASALRYPDRAN